MVSHKNYNLSANEDFVIFFTSIFGRVQKIRWATAPTRIFLPKKVRGGNLTSFITAC